MSHRNQNEMNAIKLFSIVFTVISIDLNSLKVESGNLVGREHDPANGSPPNNPDDIPLPGVNADDCVPVPINILQKLRESFSIVL